MRRLVSLVVLGLCAGLSACDDDPPNIVFPDADLRDADGGGDAEPDGDVSDAGCQSDDQCDDGIDCTSDRCDRSTGLCDHTAEHARCRDALVCNGIEYCDSQLGCQPGPPNQDCNDHDACTVDTCIEPETEGGLPTCGHAPMDRDGDGHVDDHCRVEPGNIDSPFGDDCDDLDPLRHPDAGEFCFDGEDNDCDQRIDSLDEDCTLQNDTCDTAIELPAGVTREGFTFGAAGDHDIGCDWVGDPEVVYWFEVPETSDVTIEAWGDDYYPYLAVQSVCGDVGSELGCVSGGTNVRFFQRAMEPGTYYLIVKSWWEGSFRLLLTIDEASEPPAGDTCESPIPLEDGVTSTIDIGLFEADTPISCMTNEGYMDATFVFNLTEESDVRYEVDGDGFTPYVSISWACGDSEGEVACDGANPQTRSLCALPAGTYFMTVRGNRPGDVDVTVTAEEPSEAPENDTCEGATDVSRGGTFPGTLLCTARDELQPSCGFDVNHEVFYTFGIDEPMDVTISATAEDSLIPTVALQGECGSGVSELFCVRAAEATRTIRSLAPGRYAIVVGGEYQADFELAVDFAPATSGCDGAEVLTGSATISGNNTGAGDDFRGSCGNGGEGNDVPYVIDVPYDFDLRANVTSAISNTILYLRGECDNPLTELACNDNRPGSSTLSELTRAGLDGGVYTLVVDSWGWWGEGPFTVDLEITPVDTCSTAPVLGASSTVSGDTCLDPPIYEGSCGGADAPEHVTTINLAVESDLRAEVTSAAFVPTLYLRAECAAAPSEAGCVTGGVGTALEETGLMPGRYYLFVDGSAADACGEYEIDVTITPR